MRYKGRIVRAWLHVNEEMINTFDVVKYVQYYQQPIGYYGLEVKTSEERNGAKMYKKLQDGKKEVKEICFDPNFKTSKQDYLDMFERGR